MEFINGNQVFIGTEKTTEGFHELRKFRHILQKEHFVSLLASSLVPITPIMVKDGKYYSKEADSHDAANEISKANRDLFCLALCVVFRDMDKPGINMMAPNIINGVSFDFDAAHFNKKDIPVYKLYFKTILDRVKNIKKDEIVKMAEQSKKFRSYISGEDGKKFLLGNMKIANFKDTDSPVEKIQEILLERVDEFDSILRDILQGE